MNLPDNDIDPDPNAPPRGGSGSTCKLFAYRAQNFTCTAGRPESAYGKVGCEYSKSCEAVGGQKYRRAGHSTALRRQVGAAVPKRHFLPPVRASATGRLSPLPGEPCPPNYLTMSETCSMRPGGGLLPAALLRWGTFAGFSGAIRTWGRLMSDIGHGASISLLGKIQSRDPAEIGPERNLWGCFRII